MGNMHKHALFFTVRKAVPALLQSTVKVFFWPMKALESPAPLEITLLASDENFGRVEKDPATEDDFMTVSTRTDDVSCRECPPDRRAPGRKDFLLLFCFFMKDELRWKDVGCHFLSPLIISLNHKSC